MSNATPVNHKADRQLAKRNAKEGARYARQQKQGYGYTNVRTRDGRTHVWTRLRDGKEI